MFVFAITKFSEGAWIVIFLIPALVITFFSIHHHYKQLASQLSLENRFASPAIVRERVILLVGGVHQGTLSAMRFARSISDDVTAVHIGVDEQEAERVKNKWAVYGDGIRLVILNSPYRLMIEPLLEYIQRAEAMKRHNEVITIVVPRFISRSYWSDFLHMRTAETLRKVLLYRDDVVIVEVPYQVK
jgi:hypothetical protein